MGDDKDQAAMPPLNGRNDLPERVWDYDDFTADDDLPTDFAAGLVSLAFIRAAIRRSMRFWCAMAAAGFLISLGLYVAAAPSYQASTSLLLSDIVPGVAPGSAILDDQAVAQSRTVAGLAMRRLGLRQSVSSFLAKYTVTVISPRVLVITVSAPSSNDAVSRANALATAYLGFRKYQLETEQKLVLGSLDQQINLAKQHIKSISDRISQLSAQSASPAQQTKLTSLRAERSQASNALAVLVQTTAGNQASTQAATASQVKDSGVLDPAAPVPHRRFRPLLTHAAIGLIAGLTLGLGIVIVRALVSDRLRRRDDVAHALGAPVTLSVGSLQPRWLWLPSGRRRGRDLMRMVAHLRAAVPTRSRGAVALAVVAVDNAQAVAPSLVALAVACAQEGKQIVVADLANGAPAARLLGAGKPGIRAVRVNGAHLVVAVPGHDDVVPVGPLPQTSPQAQPAKASEALTAAYASADILLTLVTLDPSLNADHLATWATGAVVVVTAGRSSWTKIHAVGEMIRLSGTRLVSAVLVGADNTDESLGVTYTPGAGIDADVMEEGLRSAPESFVTVDRGLGREPSGDR